MERHAVVEFVLTGGRILIPRAPTHPLNDPVPGPADPLGGADYGLADNAGRQRQDGGRPFERSRPRLTGDSHEAMREAVRQLSVGRPH
jgi:hypothetical protein